MKYRGKVWIITCAIASLICVVAVSIVVTNFNSVPVTPEQAQTVSEKISSETSDQQQDPRMNPEINPAYGEEMRKTVVQTVLVGKNVDELIEESNLVAICELKEKSDTFQIESVSGGISNFTDYYFKVSETLRGELEGEDKIVTVRIRGGTFKNWSLEMSHQYEFEIGEKYLLFLYQPGMGQGYNTQGDYYYLTGSVQGIFPLNKEIDTLSEAKSSSAVLNNGFGDTIQLSSIEKQIETANKAISADEYVYYEQYLENKKENLDSGWITQEEYEEASKIFQQYATYVGDPPQYSGGD